MIKLSNGHKFEFMAASGSLWFDGQGWFWEKPFRWLNLLDPYLFTVVTKTITRNPRQGNIKIFNPLSAVRFLDGGILNAAGLGNPGFDWWCREIGSKLQSSKINLVVSLHSENTQEITEMAWRLNKYDIRAIELNVSCPNIRLSSELTPLKILEMVRETKRVSRLPIILKVGAAGDYRQIAKKVEYLVEAISLNFLPWSHVFGSESSPLHHLGGGAVSGKPAQKHNWRAVEELVKHTSIPIIGPSVWDYEDISHLKKIGAKAISFGSIFLRHPWRPTLYVRRHINSHE